MTLTVRRLVVLAASALLAGVSVAGAASAGSPQPTPAIVNSHTVLLNGKPQLLAVGVKTGVKVKVSSPAGSWTPGATVRMGECNVVVAAGPGGPLAGCALSTYKTAVVAADGSVAATTVTLVGGQLGTDPASLCPVTAATLAAGGNCGIAVQDQGNPAELGGALLVPKATINAVLGIAGTYTVKCGKVGNVYDPVSATLTHLSSQLVINGAPSPTYLKANSATSTTQVFKNVVLTTGDTVSCQELAPNPANPLTLIAVGNSSKTITI